MKKLLVALCFSCALALAVQAQDAKPKSEPTPEQKALKKELMDKYDTNKDGKLDKEEKAKVSAEDKAKMEKAGMGGKKKKKEAKPE